MSLADWGPMRLMYTLEVQSIERVRTHNEMLKMNSKGVLCLTAIFLGGVNQLMSLKYFEVLDTCALAAVVFL